MQKWTNFPPAQFGQLFGRVRSLARLMQQWDCELQMSVEPSSERERSEDLKRLRETARAIVIHVPDLPIGVWGSCFAVAYQRRLFIVTAAHLTKANHSGHLRVAAAHDLRRSFRLGQGTLVSPPDDPDGLDIIVYPTGPGGLDEDTLANARIINLEDSVTAWQPSAYVSEFLVVGFPRDLNEVDYESRVIKTAQVMLRGKYQAVVRVDGHVHQLVVDNPHNLEQFAGFSGAPVFSVEHQVGAAPHIRFCGVVVTGSAPRRLMHFFDADAIRFVLNTAIEHLVGVHVLTGPPPDL